MGFSFGLLAVSAAVAAAVLFVALPRVGRPGASMLFLRLAAVSGLAAVASSVMYLIYGAGGGIVPLVLADTAMVLAPALLFVALRVLEGESARRWSVGVVAAGLSVAVVSAVWGLPASGFVKVALLAVICTGCAVTAARSKVEPWACLRVVMLTTGAYALYCVLRIVLGVVAGMDSALYGVVFSFGTVTAVGGFSVLLVGAAIIPLFAGRRSTADRRASRAPGVVVVVGDWDLASAAYGSDRMRGLVHDLRAAGRAVDPDATDVPRGVEVGVPQPVATLAERLRATFGWTADEITLLADGASTGAIRTRPHRGWSPGRSPRI